MGGKKPFTLADEAAWIRAGSPRNPDITGRELLAELIQRAGCRGTPGPADRRGVADLEAPCRFCSAHTASHRSDHAFA
jgi:hypothetical protein